MHVDVLRMRMRMRMRMKQGQLQYLTLKATDSDFVLFDPSDRLYPAISA